MARAFLATRGWLTVSGPDAFDFLQGLITTDLDSLEPGVAAPGALLTPQGKIMFFFMISKSDSGFLVETDAGSLDALIKRLTMYKLRAKVDLAKLEASNRRDRRVGRDAAGGFNKRQSLCQGGNGPLPTARRQRHLRGLRCLARAGWCA